MLTVLDDKHNKEASHELRDKLPTAKVETEVNQRQVLSAKSNTIAKGFSRAARHYDKHAQVQQRIAKALVDWQKSQPSSNSNYANSVALDIGCGTGQLALMLSGQFAQWFNLDLSFAMLQQARQKAHAENMRTKRAKSVEDKQHFILGHANELPFATRSIDKVYSSMALQWSENPFSSLAEIHRVLKPHGEASIAFMIEGSFYSLESAWERAGYASRLNRFADKSRWISAFERLKRYATKGNERIYENLKEDMESGIAESRIAESTAGSIEENTTQLMQFSTWHPNLLHALKSLKAIGANTALSKAKANMLGKREIERVESLWSREQDMYSLEYHVLFMHWRKGV
uniref:methyltransferase domain-containing protein n=1 Tax=Ningiella ruwaisensis TaxID=2364274 RepID=UPI0010A05450|nr:methyltransferase domain-containing protein [Ningiella ruwaisensis]